MIVIIGIPYDPQWIISRRKWMWRHFLLSPSMQGSSTLSVWSQRFYEYNFFIYWWKQKCLGGIDLGGHLINGFGSLRFWFASFLTMMEMDIDRGVITVQPWWLWSYYDTKRYCIVLGECLWLSTWMYVYNILSVIMAGRINFRCREVEGARVYLRVFQFTTVNFSHVTYHALDSAHVVYVRK